MTLIIFFFFCLCSKASAKIDGGTNLSEDSEDTEENPQVKKRQYTKTKQNGEKTTYTDEIVQQLLYNIKVFKLDKELMARTLSRIWLSSIVKSEKNEANV